MQASQKRWLKSVRGRLRVMRQLFSVADDVWDGYSAGERIEVVERSTTEAVAPNPLETYFDSHDEGPGIWKWRHYFDVYSRHLSKFRSRPVHVLEIGIYSGGGLAMWRDYFGEQATLYGVDIEPACKAYEAQGVKVFIGDQGDRDFWNDFRQKVPNLDVVIDDGGHRPDQQIVTLESLLPHLRPGGVYICEDAHGRFQRFHAYVYGMSQHMHVLDFSCPHGSQVYSSPATTMQRHIASIHAYPCMTVVERTAAPRTFLSSDKRGTVWAPFVVR